MAASGYSLEFPAVKEGGHGDKVLRPEAGHIDVGGDFADAQPVGHAAPILTGQPAWACIVDKAGSGPVRPESRWMPCECPPQYNYAGKSRRCRSVSWILVFGGSLQLPHDRQAHFCGTVPFVQVWFSDSGVLRQCAATP